MAYDESSCETRINSMWSSSYNVIANINELIGYIDEANPGMFTGRNYHLIRGEAYGLRAMLHFDILRLFAPSYKAGASTKASLCNGGRKRCYAAFYRRRGPAQSP